MTYHIQR